MEDLIVSFDKNDRNNEAGLCVVRKYPNGDTKILKMVLDEQARILYKLLTDQSAKAEIKAESDHKCHTCKHYLSGEYDGSCDSYICEHYSGWEARDTE